MKAPNAKLFWKAMNVGTRLNVAIYRASGGKRGNTIKGAPVLLLHHRGRKSGKQRVAPVLYLEDGDRLVIVASRGGTHQHPAWFHNIKEADSVGVEVGRDRRTLRPRVASAEERAELWPRLVEMYPDYAEYQTFTDREIPVVVLDPTGGGA